MLEAGLPPERQAGQIQQARHQSFLAFDFGTRRVGVASGNTLIGAATPLTTVALQGDARFDAIARLVAQWQPDALVVGVPYHPDGAPHDNTVLAQRFARQLQGRLKLPVVEVDERYTTTEALADARQAGRKNVDADADAAAIILNQHLRQLAVSMTPPLESHAAP
jgi:putative holliday junction resolvase